MLGFSRFQWSVLKDGWTEIHLHTFKKINPKLLVRLLPSALLLSTGCCLEAEGMLEEIIPPRNPNILHIHDFDHVSSISAYLSVCE